MIIHVRNTHTTPQTTKNKLQAGDLENSERMTASPYLDHTELCPEKYYFTECLFWLRRVHNNNTTTSVEDGRGIFVKEIG